MEPSAATANSPLNSGLRHTTIHTESPGVSTLPSLDESGACPWSKPGRLPPMSREANTRVVFLMDRRWVIVGVWVRCYQQYRSLSVVTAQLGPPRASDAKTRSGRTGTGTAPYPPPQQKSFPPVVRP